MAEETIWVTDDEDTEPTVEASGASMAGLHVRFKWDDGDEKKDVEIATGMRRCIAYFAVNKLSS